MRQPHVTSPAFKTQSTRDIMRIGCKAFITNDDIMHLVAHHAEPCYPIHDYKLDQNSTHSMFWTLWYILLLQFFAIISEILCSIHYKFVQQEEMYQSHYQGSELLPKKLLEYEGLLQPSSIRMRLRRIISFSTASSSMSLMELVDCFCQLNK